MPELKKRDYTPAARGPLDGVRVLDLSRLFAGNILTQILGDYGAGPNHTLPTGGTARSSGVRYRMPRGARNRASSC